MALMIINTQRTDQYLLDLSQQLADQFTENDNAESQEKQD